MIHSKSERGKKIIEGKDDQKLFQIVPSNSDKKIEMSNSKNSEKLSIFILFILGFSTS